MNRRCGARAEGKFICTLPSRKEETPPLWWGKDERFSFLFALSSLLSRYTVTLVTPVTPL